MLLLLSKGLEASASCIFGSRSASTTSVTLRPPLPSRVSRSRWRQRERFDFDDENGDDHTRQQRRRRRKRRPLRALFNDGVGEDPSEGGLAEAAEDLLRALRAEPESSSSRGGRGKSRSGGVAVDGGDGENVDVVVDCRGPAARRADELARDGMWPLYEALGDFATLLDLAQVQEEDDDVSSTDGVDAEALSLLRLHPSLLLLPRDELARRMVLLKRSLGSGADAASLARRLPWLLCHADPGDVVRPALRQMARLMPGVSGGGGGAGGRGSGGSTEALVAARLFGGGSGSGERTGRKGSRIAGRASQGWLTFADIARSLDRKLKVEERERRSREEER